MTTKKQQGGAKQGRGTTFDLASHFKAVWGVVKPELDKLEARNEERFQVLLSKLDGELAQRHAAPIATVIVQHEKCETDREKAERYEQKLYKFMGSTQVSAKTAHFLQGVLDHIESQHFISTRQSEAVDQIIGEYY